MLVSYANWQRPKAIPQGVMVEQALLKTNRRLRPPTDDADRLHHRPTTNGGIDMGCEIREAVCMIYQLAKTNGNSLKVAWVIDKGESLLAAADRRPDQLQTTMKEGIE